MMKILLIVVGVAIGMNAGVARAQHENMPGHRHGPGQASDGGAPPDHDGHGPGKHCPGGDCPGSEGGGDHGPDQHGPGKHGPN